MRKTWLLSFVIALLPGCVVAAVGVGAAAGILIHEAYIADDSYEGVFKCTLDQAFDATVEAMEDLSLTESHNRKDHTVKGEINGSDVSVKLSPVDEKEVKVKVTARKHSLADQTTAVNVFRKINRKLTKQG